MDSPHSFGNARAFTEVRFVTFAIVVFAAFTILVVCGIDEDVLKFSII